MSILSWQKNVKEIPDQIDGHIVRSIGFTAFFGCDTIKSVKIPNSIRYIKDAAFAVCKKLYSITIPEGVEYIGEKAFMGCPGLGFIYLPNSLKRIGRAAFKDSDYRHITAVVPYDSYAEELHGVIQALYRRICGNY